MPTSHESILAQHQDRMYKSGYDLPDNYTYKDALIELQAAIEEKSDAKISLAFDHLAYSMSFSDFRNARNEINSFSSPEIKKWILNVSGWYKQFDHDKYLRDLILLTNKQFLYMDITDYVSKMNGYKNKLEELTHIKWKFDGIEFISSATNDWRENDPTHPNETANRIIDVLIARGILSGDYHRVNYYWHCDVLKGDELLQINRDLFLSEIQEASKLLSIITHKPCNLLSLYPVEYGGYYRILENIGCIRVKTYNAFDVRICDFNLDQLRGLVAQGKTIEQIWEDAESKKDNKEKIKIGFHIGFNTEVNTINISPIPSMKILDKIKAITRESGFLFNAFGEDEIMGLTNEHSLIIYLPNHDENCKPYGDFGYLFENSRYTRWKDAMIQNFPELKDKFQKSERKARGNTELCKIRQAIRDYDSYLPYKSGLFNRSSDFNLAIEKLKKREEELEKELHPDYFARHRRGYR